MSKFPIHSPIHSIHGETFCHESEDIEKVKKAFELFFSKKDIKQKSRDGAYGTKVKILSADVKGKKAQKTLDFIVSSLSRKDKETLSGEIRKRIDDDGKFYMRFDKQQAFKNEKIVLCNCEDAVQIIISLEGYPAKIGNFVESARKIFS